jgi:hypothetical protein
MNEQVKISLVAFNFVVMLYMLYRIFTREETWTFLAFMGAAGIAIVLGAIVGAVAYFAASKMSS